MAEGNQGPRGPRAEVGYVRARDARGKMRLFAAVVLWRGDGRVGVRVGGQSMTLRAADCHAGRKEAQEANPRLRFAQAGEEAP